MKEATDKIVLNSLDIDISSVTFKNDKGTSLKAAKIDLLPEDETAVLTFPEKLPVGKTGCLNFDFVGQINDKMKGLYRSKYHG